MKKLRQTFARILCFPRKKNIGTFEKRYLLVRIPMPLLKFAIVMFVLS